jgi:hypothetical protein
LATSNFNSLGLSGTVVFSRDTFNNSHGLADAITFPVPQLAIPAYHSQSIGVTITGIKQLAPGGHYAAVLVQSSPLTPTLGATVTLKESVASLIFLSTAGQGSYSLSLRSLPTVVAGEQLPINLNLVFTNNGNVQVAPSGYVVITNPFGHLVSKTILNPDASLVLPNTSRLLQTNLPSSQPVWPGRYTDRVYYRAINSAHYQVMTQYVYYIGLLGELAVLLVCVVIAGASIVYKNVFSTKSRIHPQPK